MARAASLRVVVFVLLVMTFLACDTLPAAPEVAAQAARRVQAASGNGFAAPDEFVGPFASWTNVRDTYGAAGDGRTDDTAALQQGLSELRKNGRSPVLYLPAGTYRITRTLVLAYEIHVSLIGENPSAVTLVWDGPQGGTMLWVNAVAYSQISRITFDGRRSAAVAVEQSADGTGGHFDTGNHYADDRFIDVAYGIRGGFKRAGGFAETSILRSYFVRNTRAGVALGNFNALDIWVWNSLFDHCRVGVTNEPGAGNFRVYDSVFLGSTQADLLMQNTGSFSARGNHSVASAAFYVSGAAINHPAAIDIHANVIVDPRSTAAIQLGNQGPGLIVDNVIRSRSGAQGPVVRWQSAIDADVASVGNTFTVVNPLSVGGRLLSVDDHVVPRSAVAVGEPRLPRAVPRRNREVFDVPPGADSATVQRVIDAAARAVGPRPVVHFPAGLYPISESVVVPPGDLQIVGDGGDTRLQWKGGSTGPVLKLVGPTSVTVRELAVVGTAEVDGIVAEGIDQRGARISMAGVQLSAGGSSNLFVDGIAHAAMQLVDVDHKYLPRGASVRVVSAHRDPAREPGGRVTIFSGASSGNALSYDISGPATVLVRDIWYEGTTAEGFARIRDGANFTMQGARVSTPATGPTAFAISNAGGRTALLTTHVDERVVASGAGPMRILGLGLLFEFHERPVFDDVSIPRADARLLNGRRRAEQQGRRSPGSVPLPDVGDAAPAFIRDLLANTRAVVSPSWEPTEAGSTDLRMFRVFVTQSRTNVLIRP